MEFLLAGVVPHGIFEIPAIILAGALAVTITLGVYQKLDNRQFPLKSVILDAFKTFLFVCLPLLLIAALVESFVTPLFLGV
jgi:stage II sporulation protein M